MDYFNAFWVGGLICALVQILLDKPNFFPDRFRPDIMEGHEKSH